MVTQSEDFCLPFDSLKNMFNVKAVFNILFDIQEFGCDFGGVKHRLFEYCSLLFDMTKNFALGN